MNITPDDIVYWQLGPVTISATLLFTWVVMALLVGVSLLVTRRLSTGTRIPRGQNVLEVLVGGIRDQIKDVTGQAPDRYLPFIGTLFLFILTSNVLTIVPGYHPPTGSLSTTAALALCVFFAVPIYGIADRGLWGYLKTYASPHPLMLPFNILGELTRTISLAIRLFGNIMSGTMLAATILAIAPLFFPIILQFLGLLIGVIQAYIFSILALVFISSATRAHPDADDEEVTDSEEEQNAQH